MQDDVLSPGSGTGQPIFTHCCCPLLHKCVPSAPEAWAVGKSQAGTKDFGQNPASPVPGQPHARLVPLSRKGAAPLGTRWPLSAGGRIAQGTRQPLQAPSRCGCHPFVLAAMLETNIPAHPTTLTHPCAPRAPHTGLCPRGQRSSTLQGDDVAQLLGLLADVCPAALHGASGPASSFGVHTAAAAAPLSGGATAGL